MTNADLLRTLGIEKAEGGSINLSTVNFDSILPRADILPMINLTRSHNAWLKEISSHTRSKSTGKVPILDLNETVMEYVGEQDPNSPTTRPDSSKADYRTRKHKAVIVLSHEELREAAGVIDGDFEATVAEMFSKQLGNNVAYTSINGDRTLAATSRLNRSLRGVDGLAVKTAAGSNIVDRNGVAFSRKLFGGLYDRVPQRWRNDRSALRWMYNDRVDNTYREALTQIATPLGDSAAITVAPLPPLGIKPLIVPQILDNQGPTAIAPTSASDETTYIQLILTTLVTAGNPATAAAGVDRKFLVTCTATGQSEVCLGFLDTTLRINTAGLLGQSSISTTAGHYTVRPYDQTDIYLGDPKGFIIVWLDEWRMFREYNAKLDQLEITIYLEFDLLLPVPQMIIRATNVAVPPLPLA